ncbi:MAG TPA: hypothetical protein VGD10_02435 [Allosphingosinicella sp.]|uniref:hypothetical protein n=1 Tax=Allosphingosinicella sp. TaxID=2823234 RepID=UPI002EDB4C82
MKLKMLGTLAAIALAAGTAYAAADMKDCCKGEECCCKEMKKDGEPKKEEKAEAHKH